ncbi:MAG: hypothetical protein J6V83_05365, partial [Clostridia bacterium]|nr:hypothetical protein [Clostridia bacterium]
DCKIMMGITPCAQAQEYDDTTTIMTARVITLTEDGGLSTYITQGIDGKVYREEILIYKIL